MWGKTLLPDPTPPLTDPQLTGSTEQVGKKKDENTEKPKHSDGETMWGDSVLGASVAGLLLVVREIFRGLPWPPAVAGTQGSPMGHWASSSTWGRVFEDLAKGLAALLGALPVVHLQGRGGVVTVVDSQLGVVDVPPGPRSPKAHLAGTLVCAHLELSLAGAGCGSWIVEMPRALPYPVMPDWLVHLLIMGSLMRHWPAFMVASWKFCSCFS